MIQDLAASVHQRLLYRAKAEGRPFNDVLQYFAPERFLYRLGRSPYHHPFALKGALMHTVGERITEAADYAGVRARFNAHLGRSRIPMQVDVGFGDPIAPGPSAVRLPTILDFPPPELQGYSRESTIADKAQIMVALARSTAE